MSGHTTELDLQAYPIRITDCRVHDAPQTVLPADAANDDMGVVAITPGTTAPTLQGVDFGGTSTDEKCTFQFALPQSYRHGETITIRCHAGMLTTVSDGTATLDCECWQDDGDGTVSADICATAAQSINSLTLADRDFTITPTGLEGGDLLNFRLSFGGSDSGNAAVMIPTVTAVTVLLDINPLQG